jgi:5'-3' exonuclease
LPKSIPDYLALVGDSADGYPGLQRWGAKSASAVLARYLHLEHIPEDANSWDVRVAGAKTLASTLAQQREQALLFRTLATLRCDIHLFDSVDELKWTGAAAGVQAMIARLGIEDRFKAGG